MPERLVPDSLKQRVNKRCGCRPGEQYEHPEQQQHGDDWYQPVLPLLSYQAPQLRNKGALTARPRGPFEITLGFHDVLSVPYWIDQYCRKYRDLSVRAGLGLQYEPGPGLGRSPSSSRPLSRKTRASGVNSP